jgi:hypothetical protein
MSTSSRLRSFDLAVLTAVATNLGAAAACGAPAQDAANGWSATGALLVHAADRDRDGAVPAAEWMAFAGALRADARGRFDRNELLAELFEPFFDGDGNGAIEVFELAAVHTRWDANGDGAVDAADADRHAALFETERAFVEQLALRLADAREAVGADAPHDGRVTAGEWARFVAAQPQADARLLPSALYAWPTLALELPPPVQRDAFTPDVYLLTVVAELDVDKDGALTLADLMTLHGRMDADGDGLVSAAELAPPALDDQAGDSGSANAVAELGIRDLYPPADAAQRSLPPLAPFQRSLDDALLLVERTGKPLLLCVNMDDETASEALAWYLYRDPAFAALMDGFVCVLASPDDRNALDHDDRGRRLPDQRFGRILDREAIEVEPLLFERWFRGTRAAPRHVGVAPDGSILFDVYLVDDLSIVADALRTHGAAGAPTTPPAADLSLAQLLDSPEASHRDHLERVFESMPVEQRIALVETALEATRRVQHPQLVRLGLRDPEERVRAAALRAAASRPGALPHDLLVESAARADLAGEQGDRLVDGLRRWILAEPDAARRERAQRLLDSLVGARSRSRVVDAQAWRVALELAPLASAPPAAALDQERAIAALEAALEGLQLHPGDSHWLALAARAALVCGEAALASGQNPLFHFQDAAAFAERAGAPAAATLARARWLLSDFGAADAAAALALPQRLDAAGTLESLELLRLLARVRGQRLDEERSSELVADVLAAHAVVAAHPLASRDDHLARIGRLGALELPQQQRAAVLEALARLPHDVDLHAWLRALDLAQDGAAALSARYDDFLAERGDDALVTWFAGLARIAAAEHAVRARQVDEALRAYDACRRDFDAAVALEPGYVASSAWYTALAAAGSARLHADAGRLAEAVADLEDAFRRDGGALDQVDGLGVSPRATLSRLADAVDAAGDADLAARLARLGGGT